MVYSDEKSNWTTTTRKAVRLIKCTGFLAQSWMKTNRKSPPLGNEVKWFCRVISAENEHFSGRVKIPWCLDIYKSYALLTSMLIGLSTLVFFSKTNAQLILWKLLWEEVCVMLLHPLPVTWRVALCHWEKGTRLLLRFKAFWTSDTWLVCSSGYASMFMENTYMVLGSLQEACNPQWLWTTVKELCRLAVVTA